jgi:hypothetical protein
MGQQDSEHNTPYKVTKFKSQLGSSAGANNPRQSSAMQTGGAVSEKVEVEKPRVMRQRKSAPIGFLSCIRYANLPPQRGNQLQIVGDRPQKSQLRHNRNSRTLGLSDLFVEAQRAKADVKPVIVDASTIGGDGLRSRSAHPLC